MMFRRILRSGNVLAVKSNARGYVVSEARHEIPSRKRHVPLLVEETMTALQVKEGNLYVDMTFGSGGHTRALLEQGARVLAIDRDPTVSGFAAEITEEFGEQFIFENDKYTKLPAILSKHEVAPSQISGVLIECGCSNMQMTSARGFNAAINAPLDMRMDPRDRDTPPAAAIVNHLDAEDMARIFKHYGSERKYKKIAYAILDHRLAMNKIRTTKELSSVIDSAFVGGFSLEDTGDVATSRVTKIFTALRYFVNDELNELNKALFIIHKLLNNGVRAAIITTEAAEDKIVKRHFQDIQMEDPTSSNLQQKYRSSLDGNQSEAFISEKPWQPINPRKIEPSDAEIERNPIARNAKLRVAEKRHVPTVK